MSQNVLDDSTDLVGSAGGEEDRGVESDGDADPSAASSSVIVGSPRKTGPSPDRFAARDGPHPQLAGVGASDVVFPRTSSTSELSTAAHGEGKPVGSSSGITYLDWRGDWLVCGNKTGAVRAFNLVVPSVSPAPTL